MISIIIPTYKRYDLLRDCIRSILNAETPPVPYEIIVVDDGGHLSKALEAEFLGSPITWVYLPANKGQMNAQRTGFERASGDIVAFLDDDCEVDRCWLVEIARFFSENPDIQCISGHVQAFDSSHILARTRQQTYDARHRKYTAQDHNRRLRNQWNLTTADSVLLSNRICEGNYAIRRGFVEVVDLFGLSRSFDQVTSEGLMRRGYAIAYHPAMIIHHKHDTRFLTVYRIGRRKARIQYGSREDLNFKMSLPLWHDLFTAPVAIRQRPEMYRADRSRLKVYGVITILQWLYALGSLSMFLQIYVLKLRQKLR